MRHKCKLSICAIMKNEAPYLREWLEFHRLVGVERFYLYDNSSTDDTVQLIQSYAQSIDIVLNDWAIRPGQIPAFEHCLATYGDESEWIAFIDLDEFLFPTTQDDLRDVLEDFAEVSGVGVNWLTFGSSHHKKRPIGLQIEQFTKRSETQAPVNKHLKCIVRPDQTLRSSGCAHFFIHPEGCVAVTETGEAIDDAFSSSVSVEKLRINHYATRSHEEMQEKMLRGRPDLNVPREWHVMQSLDVNDVEDLTIQRFVPKLKQAFL
jgi:glycosyltransferase involved in cell wall biosynthesis